VIVEKTWRPVVALLGVLSVTSLLAWVYGLGSFRTWFLVTGAPAVVALVALAIAAARGRGPRDLRLALVGGALGGLAGTIGYDLFRIPFVVGGLRLFAPIDSYGVLLMGADGSSPTTGFVGWAYHFTNGIGFGIAYAAVALGRRWPWAVLWGLLLETATIVTPFVDSYGLRGHWDLIAIAYAAHIGYGVPLGLIVQRAKHWDPIRPLLIPMSALLVMLVVGLGIWLRPGTRNADDQRGGAAAAGPSVLVKNGKFHPEWTRYGPGECVTLTNADATSYTLAAPPNKQLPANATIEICPTGKGAHRVKLDGRPYSGGFLLFDPAR
jgi:hypothetical protein